MSSLQILSAERRVTSRAEAGLVGCVSLLCHILPYLADATLLSALQVSRFHSVTFTLLSQALRLNLTRIFL